MCQPVRRSLTLLALGAFLLAWSAHAEDRLAGIRPLVGSTPAAQGASFPAAAASPPLWGALEAGPHPIGFLVRHEYDYGRSWFPQWEGGGPTTAAPGRPVRIMVWFPAAAAGAEARSFREYVELPATDPSFEALERRLRAYDLGEEGGSLLGLVGGSREKLEALLAAPVAARRGATPARGRFPLVLYSLGQNDMTQENVVLWEYLASHGFVVATVPHLGINPRKFHLWSYEGLSFEAQLRDLELALDRLAREPWVDVRRTAVMGHSMGGTYAMLLAIRNPAIDALIGLDASFVFEQPSFQFDFLAAPYFQPWRLKAPVLQLFRKRDQPDDRVLDQLIYSDRHLVELENLTHGDFQAWRLYPGAEIDPRDLVVRPAKVGARGFLVVADEVRRFLESVLNEGELPTRGSGQRTLDGVVISERLVPGVRGPDAEELYALLERDGYERALAAVEAARQRNPGCALFADAEIMGLGNELRWGGKGDRAVELFRLFVTAAPDSATAHWKLGQALEEAKQVAAAVEEYRATLRLDPQHAQAQARVEELGRAPVDE